jgi:hypothetical protein
MGTLLRLPDHFGMIKTTLFVLLLGTLSCAFGQVERIDLGSRGQITLYLLGDWKADVSTLGGNTTLTISPSRESVNASATLAISFPEVDRFETKSRLKLRVETDAYNLTEESVEGRAVAREFRVPAAMMGFYCSFTDRNLRGQPPQKGNYKVMSLGKIKLAPDVLVDVQIMADGFRDEPYQQLLGAIEGMEFKPGPGR